MNCRQFDIWKCKPTGFEKAHWFVIISPNEICTDERELAVNGLACFSLRGNALKTDVRLNGADGFDHPTVCGCDFFYSLPKAGLHESIGPVTSERRTQIARLIREVFRFG